jgi:3-isopropylmalate dehydratase small subunit
MCKKSFKNLEPAQYITCATDRNNLRAITFTWIYKILEFFANLPTESNGSMLVYTITFEFISSRLSPYVIYINKAYGDLHQ